MPGSQPDNRPALDRTKQTRNAFTEQERLDQQTLNILAGRRVADRKHAAVRVEDLIGILQMPQNLRSKAAAGAPTKAEYDLLVADVARLHELLRSVSSALQRRITG